MTRSRRSLPVAALLAAALAGCATHSVEIRSLPEATPAADNAAAVESRAALAAAVASAATEQTDQNGEPPAPRFMPADAPSMVTYDPWERLNRFTYRCNARFDTAVFLRLSNGYRRLPSPLRTGVHNFFGNLTELSTMVNDALQWRLGRGVRSLGRFLVNSTVGIGGLIDVAKQLRLPTAPTGFSDTLGTWGVHPGPYLVLPLFGPSTLRDTIGLAGDIGTRYGINLFDLYRGSFWKTGSLDVVDAVDQRANTAFRYYETGSPFEYDDIRFLYVRKRLLEDTGLHRREKPQRPPPGIPAGQ